MSWKEPAIGCLIATGGVIGIILMIVVGSLLSFGTGALVGLGVEWLADKHVEFAGVRLWIWTGATTLLLGMIAGGAREST